MPSQLMFVEKWEILNKIGVKRKNRIVDLGNIQAEKSGKSYAHLSHIFATPSRKKRKAVPNNWVDKSVYGFDIFAY